MVMEVETVGIAVADLFAGCLRAILHHNHLKVTHGLCREALEQFIHLVGAVEHGDDDGESHGVFRSWMVNVRGSGVKR
jgi:hypothetical protein